MPLLILSADGFDIGTVNAQRLVLTLRKNAGSDILHTGHGANHEQAQLRALVAVYVFVPLVERVHLAVTTAGADADARDAHAHGHVVVTGGGGIHRQRKVKRL